MTRPAPAPEDAGAAELSVVVPVHNEEAVLDRFFEETIAVLEGLELGWEIIAVDDGSTDATLERLIAWRRRDDRIRILSLSRNFGKEAALTAGLDHSAGAAVIPIDADLQDPPALIADMVQLWRAGHDMVYARRADRGADGLVKRGTAVAFYRLFNAVAEVPVPANAGDFRLLDRRVVEALRGLPERTRFMKGLFAWLGFRQAGIDYVRRPRAAGTSKWRYWRLWNFALEGITSFSTAPLRVWSYVGGFAALLSLLYALFLVVRTLTHGVDVPGYASLMVAVLFLGGLQLLSIGILGEYLGRLFQEVKGRPIYLVRERHGLPHPPSRYTPNPG